MSKVLKLQACLTMLIFDTLIQNFEEFSFQNSKDKADYNNNWERGSVKSASGPAEHKSICVS